MHVCRKKCCNSWHGTVYRKDIAFTKKDSEQVIGKDMSAKYGKLLITFLHCHSKLLDNVGMSDQ